MSTTVFLSIVSISAVVGLIIMLLGKYYYNKTCSLKIVYMGLSTVYMGVLFILIVSVCNLFGWIEIIP